MKRQLAKEEGGLAVSSGAGSSVSGNATGAVTETEEKSIEARYRLRARVLYALSILVPFAAMALFNNPRFREYWSSPNVPRDPETGKETVTELGSDVDGIRAYFLARSWTPFRLPVFLLGSLFAARRERMRRNATDKSEDVIAFWASIVDRYAFRLILFWTLAASAHVVFGLTVAGDASRTYRFLTHPLLLLGGRVSYAAYLLQFPVWTYIDRMAYGTFKNRFPPCSRHDPEAAASWTDCFAKSGYQEWPDVMVVWNVFLLFAVAYVVNRYYESRVVAFLARKLLTDETASAASAAKRAPKANAAEAERGGAR
jgi:peptidoglycan/LPS O-acetylase OafA/YrhL